VNANEDDKMHFFIFADESQIYTWDPVRRTRGRIIATGFSNI
jgi:hypothetical protein